MRTLRRTFLFARRYKKYYRSNPIIGKKIDKALLLLEENPFHNSLKTHKAITRKYGLKYSSWVTGELRIIWDFENNTLILILLDLRDHTVYK